MARTTKIPPVHPGEVLFEDYMKPAGASMNGLALDLHVPVTRIAEIVKGTRAITADTRPPAGTLPGHYSRILDESSIEVRPRDHRRREVVAD